MTAFRFLETIYLPNNFKEPEEAMAYTVLPKSGIWNQSQSKVNECAKILKTILHRLRV